LAAIEARLDSEPDAKRAVESLLREFTLAAARHGSAWGCLTCNSAVELAPDQPAVAAAIGRHHAQLEGLLAKAIERGQRQGSIGRRHAPVEVARFLNTALNGLQVLVRARSDPDRVEGAISMILSSLD
jgi:TetR/AcrR family transcriptional repressor of nem operon